MDLGLKLVLRGCGGDDPDDEDGGEGAGAQMG